MPDGESLERFARLVARQTGFAVQPENSSRLQRILQERAQGTRDGDTHRYLALLEDDTPESHAEWQRLIHELTMGESFFFRDNAQFRLLRETLLPELIARRSQRRTLRMWSAGCSTGEEAYSLAMSAKELLPEAETWKLQIIGTDINEAALEQAREGRYGAWSMRGLTDDQRERYFVREEGGFRLRDEYRGLVKFQTGNLVRDDIPDFSVGLHDMDLILCRNVFIYFDTETTGHVAQKLARTLAPGGVLVTGHAELQGQTPPLLRTRLLPGSVVHERPSFHLPPPPVVQPSTRAAATRVPNPQSQLPHAEAAFREADYETAVQRVEAHLAQHPHDEAALRLAAVASANLGRHSRASRYCRQLLERRPQDIEARYLLAKLAQDHGDDEEARSLLMGLLEDAPSFVPAYLDLAWLEQRRGDGDLASALRAEAIRLLEQLPPGTILSTYEGLTVEDLRTQLRPSEETP